MTEPIVDEAVDESIKATGEDDAYLVESSLLKTLFQHMAAYMLPGPHALFAYVVTK